MTNSRKPIHVWALFKYYYPNFSGAAIQGHRNLSHLVQRGFSVTVLAARDHNAVSMNRNEILLDNIYIRYLPVLRRSRWQSFDRVEWLRRWAVAINALLSSISLNLACAWVLFREGKKGDIVQLYSCNEFSFLVVWLAKKQGMHPVIRTTLLGSDDPSSQRGALGALKRAAFFGAEAIVGISSALSESCLTAGLDPDRVVQIPNGVNTGEYCPVNSSARESLCEFLKLSSSRQYIVFVGAATYRKGIDILIDAFLDIQAKAPNADLLVVGPSDFGDIARYDLSRTQLLEELKRKLTAAGCAHRVHWIGEVKNVHNYLQVADVFCLPTRREGLGTVIIEAMAVGLPVITSLLPGITTDLILPYHDGILVKNHDYHSYSAALWRVLSNPDNAKALGNAARCRVKREFELTVIVERYAQLYCELGGQYRK